MDALNYFKMDLRFIGKTAKLYAFFPLIGIILFFAGNTSFGISYLFLFMIVLNVVPFSTESNSKSLKLYYSLPAKLSDMVKGRYIFLAVIVFCVWIFSVMLAIYASLKGLVSSIELFSLFISGATMTIICTIQIPLFYKFGFEKGRVLSMVIYFLPVLFSFMLPSILVEPLNNIVLKSESYLVFYAIILALVLLCSVLSYRLSIKICGNKEV